MSVDLIEGLNLGSRNRSIHGCLNMDIDQHEGVDIVGDISDLSRFGDISVGYIYASHILEHFPHTQTQMILNGWYRVIKPGGKLYVGVPDFERTIELYHSYGELKDWHVKFLCGDQAYKTAFHYNLFDEPRLTKYLKDSGFTDVFRVEQFPIGDEKDCSNMVSTHDGGLVSLNLIGVK